MKIFKKAISLILMVLITMQSMQITIFANYAEIIEIFNGDNYDDFIIIEEPDETVVFSNQENTLDSLVTSDNTPAFAHLLDAQEPSDPVIKIMNLLDIDEAAAMQMITVFGDAESALEEAELYNSLKNTYYTLNYDSVKDYLTSLVVNGYGAQRVTMSYIVADALGEDILDVMIDEYPEEEIDDEYIAILVYDYYVSPEFIYNYLEENDTTSEVMYIAIFSTFKILYPETLPSTYTDEEDETAEYPTAPFYAKNGESEYISPASGQLLYQMDLAAVAGKTAGFEWHHIVEQCQSKLTRAGLDSDLIQNAMNMISLPKEIHHEISRFYSRIPNRDLLDTGGKVFRDWLNDKSFEEQFEYGIWVISYVMNSMGG